MGAGERVEREGGGVASFAAAFSISRRNFESRWTEKSLCSMNINGDDLLDSQRRVYSATLKVLRSEYVRGPLRFGQTTAGATLTFVLLIMCVHGVVDDEESGEEAARSGVASSERDNILVRNDLLGAK